MNGTRMSASVEHKDAKATRELWKIDDAALSALFFLHLYMMARNFGALALKFLA